MTSESYAAEITRARSDIKREHDAIAKVAKDLSHCIEVGDTVRARALLAQLRDQEREHFAHEEQIMKRFGVERYEVHKDQHDAMQTTIDWILEGDNIDDLRSPEGELARHLKNHLYHLISIDEELDGFLRAALGRDD